MTDARPLLSVCMIVKNEEAVLGRALASVSGIGAELIVVDTGSTDRSVAIARAAGAQLHDFTWVNDFSAARNHALSKASGEWILSLDADEEVDPAFRERFERVLRGTEATALSILMQGVDDCGIKQNGAGGTVRLFRNRLGYVFDGRIHESVVPSVHRAGGRIVVTEELTLLHHGYTAVETARKDRRTRNRALLEQAMREQPDEPRNWHYLGVELHSMRDDVGAVRLFERMIADAPRHDMTAWSACCLSLILQDRRQWGEAWKAAHFGTSGRTGRVMCLTRLGRLALREGDVATASWCAGELERAPIDAMGSRTTATTAALEIRAAARVETSPKSPETRAFLVDAVKRHPASTVLAELLVRACEAIDGRGKGAFDAMRRAAHSRQTISAAMTAFFRGGLYAECVELNETSGVRNGSWAFALARMGRREEGSAALLGFGDSAAPFCFVFGLAYDDEATLAHGLALSTEPFRQALAHVRANEVVPPSLAWVVALWLEGALSLHEDGVASQLVACLPWSVGERTAFCALALHDFVDPIAGLGLALQAPTEPASLEVIGLVAHGHGDFAAASTMLAMRAKAGDASVRVYLKAVDAFTRLGRTADAAAMLELGRIARPSSKGLVAVAPSKSKSKKTRRAA